MKKLNTIGALIPTLIVEDVHKGHLCQAIQLY